MATPTLRSIGLQRGAIIPWAGQEQMVRCLGDQRCYQKVELISIVVRLASWRSAGSTRLGQLAIAATIILAGRFLVDRTLSPAEVRLMRAEAPPGDQLEVFFGCPIRYGAGEDRSVWEASPGVTPCADLGPMRPVRTPGRHLPAVPGPIRSGPKEVRR
jgi:hypothetical protein